MPSVILTGIAPHCFLQSSHFQLYKELQASTLHQQMTSLYTSCLNIYNLFPCEKALNIIPQSSEDYGCAVYAEQILFQAEQRLGKKFGDKTLKNSEQ